MSHVDLTKVLRNAVVGVQCLSEQRVEVTVQVLCQEVKFSRGTGAAEGRWTLNKAAGEKTLIGDKCGARGWSLSSAGKHLNG